METRHTALKDFLAILTEELATLSVPDADRAQVRSDIATIEAQLASSRPRHAILTDAVRRIKETLSPPVLGEAASAELIAAMRRLPL